MDLHVVNRMVMNTVKVLLLVPSSSLGSELFEKKNVLFPIKPPLFKMVHYDIQGMYATIILNSCYANYIIKLEYYKLNLFFQNIDVFLSQYTV